MLKQPLLPAELLAPHSKLSMSLQHQPEQAQAAARPAAAEPLKPKAKLKIKMGGKTFSAGASDMQHGMHAPCNSLLSEPCEGAASSYASLR
jgi:hypothetical protein